MKEIVKFEDWIKFDLRIGEVKKTNTKTIIRCLDKDYEVSLNLNVKKGDKIIVGVNGDGLTIPVIDGDIILIPEKDISIGSKVR